MNKDTLDMLEDVNTMTGCEKEEVWVFVVFKTNYAV